MSEEDNINILVTGVTNKETAFCSLLPSMIMKFSLSVVGQNNVDLPLKKASSQRTLHK